MVILTINGQGSRFSREGIQQPKFMLPFQGVTIIERILQNIKTGFGYDVEILVGLNKRYSNCHQFISDACTKIGLKSKTLLLDDNNGQAETAYVLLKHFKPVNSPFWVVNCDTLVDGSWHVGEPNQRVIVEVFESDSPKYSYIDDITHVSKIAEKKVISKYASTGNYYFGNAQLFNELYAVTEWENEIYISDVIGAAIHQGISVSGKLIEANNVLVLGTPEQYYAAEQ